MKRTGKQINARYDKAISDKTKWDALYEEVYEYGMPSRYNSTINLEARDKSGGDSNRFHLYTSVMEQSADRFVQKVQSMLTPVGVDWIDFEAGYLFRENDSAEDIDIQLSKIAHMLNVYKDTSNFDSVITEAYYDLVAGSMCIALLEGTPEDPFRFVAVPIKDVAIEEGIFSEVGAVYRTLRMKKELIKKQWADAKYNLPSGETEDEDVDLIEATYKDYDDDCWYYCVLEKGKDDLIVERKYKTSPFIVLRWSKCAGEVYGRGVGLKALADTKTLNKVIEYTLRALAFTIPVFLANSSDNYDPSTFKLVPGAVNPVPSTATNNPTITQLGVNQQPQMSQFEAERLEMNIKRSLLDDTIPNDPNRELTATEISHRAEELQNNFSNSFGRIMTEFMYPLIRRMIEVGQRFGYIPKEFDPKLFNGYGYKIKINTVLASGQKQKEVQSTIAALQAFMALDPQGAMIGKVLDLNKLVPDLMKKMGIDEMFVRTPEEIEQAKIAEQAAVKDMQDDAAARQMAIDENKARAQNQ